MVAARFHARHLSDLLTESAERFPTSLWFDGKFALSYTQGSIAAQRLAERMNTLGVRTGDRVAICLSNGALFGVACHAAWRIGAIVTTLHPAYPVSALIAQLRSIDPTILIGDADLTQAERMADITKALDGCSLLSIGSSDLFLNARDGNVSFSGADKDPGALALLQFTGGTTGTPKAAALTHANLSINLAQMRAVLANLREGCERSLAVAPFAHITGFNAVFNCMTMIGGTLVIPEQFSAQAAADICRQARASMLVGPPTLLAAIADAPQAPKGEPWPLRHVLSGGAPLPVDVRDRFEAVTGIAVLQGYGLSEASPAVTLSRSSGGQFGDCGFPVEGTEISVHDPATGAALPPGMVGEIQISGPQIMQGYWKRDDETCEVLVDGRLRTGDLGHVEADGRLVIVDRLKDLIIASGYNVYPSQVEEAIYQHQAVRESAVIGVADGYRGQTVKAVLALHPGCALTLDELQHFLRELLPPMAIPKQLEILPDLPKSPAGKILRRALQVEQAGVA